jgi:exodeoxyribonuclease VII large subunit
VAAREDQICQALDQMAQALSRTMRYKIVNARSRVQEQALSQAFGQVRSNLRDAAARASSADHRLQILVGKELREAHLRADPLMRRLAPSELRARFAEARSRFESATNNCEALMEAGVADARERLGLAAASLDALSPLAVLQRGYAVAQREDGTLLREAKSVSVGDSIKVRLAQGRINADITEVEEN